VTGPAVTVRLVTGPRDVVVVLLDSLNRHLLGSYGGTEFATPNLDRLAARAVRFTNHHTGSLPCMPARHDLLVGALDFPWRPWGSIEVWEDAITHDLRRDAGISTMLVSDHPHLFETGGENYHVDFGAWDYLRGHEEDPWRSRPDPSFIGSPTVPAAAAGPWVRAYDRSRTWFRDEADFPGPRTMTAAAGWLDGELSAERAAHERLLLVVDEFDPHEPFDTPVSWADRYDPGWEGDRMIWPPYARDDGESGLTERQARHLRAQYGAKLSMIDHWLGRLLDVVDRHDAWDTTAFVVCTDHGHYLGERGIWGKPSVPVQPELGHIPLLVAWPGVRPGTNGALTTTVDLHATLCDVFAVTPGHRTHGHSLRPLLEGTATSIREWALSGVWGREVHVADATRTYARRPTSGNRNRPLSMWSNRWSTMPTNHVPGLRMAPPDGRATLDRLPGSEVPVIRQPFDPSDALPFWALGRFEGNLLYDRAECDQLGALRDHLADGDGVKEEREMADLLVEALRAIEAPQEQLVRLGLE
jgi:arylsulfatase A-like enzyme